MAWTTPRTWSIGEIVTKAIMDTHVRDNLTYLHDRVIVGSVASGGTVTSGTRYTASKTSTGTYSVTFTSAFTATPIVTVTAILGTGANVICGVASLTSSGMVVHTKTDAGVDQDSAFMFVAREVQ